PQSNGPGWGKPGPLRRAVGGMDRYGGERRETRPSHRNMKTDSDRGLLKSWRKHGFLDRPVCSTAGCGAVRHSARRVRYVKEPASIEEGEAPCPSSVSIRRKRAKPSRSTARTTTISAFPKRPRRPGWATSLACPIR